jgi:hypothetical protein
VGLALSATLILISRSCTKVKQIFQIHSVFIFDHITDMVEGKSTLEKDSFLALRGRTNLKTHVGISHGFHLSRSILLTGSPGSRTEGGMPIFIEQMHTGMNV